MRPDFGAKGNLLPLSMRMLGIAVAFGACVVGSGCSTGTKPVSEAEWKALEATAAEPYRLQAGEKIHVTVYDEPSLSGDYQVDPTGFVSLPLAGTVKAAGLTQQQLEGVLEKSFSSEYLKDPKITVSVSEFRPFYIVGEVEKPGAYPYTGGLNVLSAIAIAGGRTYRANLSDVLIQHPGEAAMHEYDATTPIPILPGDIVEIPRRYF